ncbi:MAG: CAP domain-containing protein [Chloroflexota bacterium]
MVVSVALIGIPLTAVAQQLSPPEQRIVQLINQARVAQGLGPLALTPELNAAAKAHAQDMAAKGYMEHEGIDGSTPQSRAIKAGYGAPANSAWLVLEVISARQTAEAAANWLLSDRLHRGVLLRGYWREMGAAYVEGGPYGQFWVVEFGCRPNVLPVIAEPTSSGGVTLRLSNEECTPGGTAEAIGKATEVMISDKPDFSGATWEPFAATKPVTKGGSVFVRYRDAKGRETVASTGGQGASAVTVTAASASSTTLNQASPKPSNDNDDNENDNSSGNSNSNSNSNDNSSNDNDSKDGDKKDSDKKDGDSNLFTPKPTFVFQPAKP